MDKGKVRGDYASAYKLSGPGSTVDKKTLRLHRRSLEQRELRQDVHNKRRPLVDLSPVQEGDLSAVNKNYKDKTPVKPKDSKSQGRSERLEQLMKWKKEREMKKKLEVQSKNSNPVFRVSRNMNYTNKDVELFQHSKSKPQSKKPVKPHPTVAPISKTVPSTQPPRKAQPTTSARGKPAAAATATRQTTNTNTATSRKRQTSGNQSQQTKKQATEPVPARSRRQTSPVSKKKKQAPAPARNTRQSTKNKAAQAKSSKVTPAVAKNSDTAIEKLPYDMSRVRSDRGPSSADSFAPPDFSFNVSSFVFKPLSPSSAAGFLYPGQDNSCASFLESNPKRASTPKKDEDARSSSTDVATVTDKCSDTVLLDNTAINMKGGDVTQHETTVVAVHDEKPSTRRSTRQSRSVTRESKAASDKDVTLKKAEDSTICESDSVSSSARRRTRMSSRRVTRSSQRSVNDSGVALDDSQASPNSTKIDLTSSKDTSGQRRTRSSACVERSAERLVEQTKEEKVNEVVSEDNQAKQSLKRSPKPAVDQDQVSLQENSSQDNSTESSADEVFTTETPNETRRRSVRRSVSVTTVSGEASDITLNLRKFDTPKSALRKDSKSAKKVKHVTLSIELSEEEEEEVPRRSARHARRSMPSAGDKKKVSKKNQRKSMLPRLPKSPEEWVEFLSNSPMIEMTRRTPKQANLTVPALNFDDIDLEQPNFEEPTNDTAVAMETEAPASESAPKEQDTATSLGSGPDKAEEAVPLWETLKEEVTVSTSKDKVNTEESAKKPVVLEATSPKAANENVQVGEVSSTQGPNEDGSSEEHDVKYFRNLVTSETNRLKVLCSHWDEINADSSLTEDVCGQIRTTIGQAQLLMAQRFKQFLGLVDNCEFKRGEKETTFTDLQGFWDMIYFQVEDVDAKFQGLAKLQGNNWVEGKPVEVKKTKKKVSKPAVVKPVVKSKFAAFRAQMKKKASSPGSSAPQASEEEKVFEIPGFFKVASPVRTPKPHCEAGTPKKSTPVQSAVSASEQSVPSSNNLTENPIQRLYARKSYVPLVPSPLLQDTTPVPRPTRASIFSKPAATPEVGDGNSIIRDSETGESASKRMKTTPVRRSLRPRKSVNFVEEEPMEMGSPKVTNVQPCTEAQSPASDDELNISQDSFSRYLQPSNSSISGSSRRSRRSSLKGCPSAERMKSRRSVHFASPSNDDHKHIKMPRTPFNRDSIVKQKRVTRRSVSEAEDIFSIDNIDNDENTPPPSASFRSPRPSLLFTPPERKNSPRINTNVPTATLISFTP